MFKKMTSSYGKLFQSAGRKLFAQTCLCCQRRVEGSSILCHFCLVSTPKSENCCETCGQRLIGEATVNRCRACLDSPLSIEALDFAFDYQDIVSDLLVATKLARRVDALSGLQQLLHYHLRYSQQRYRHSETYPSSPLYQYWQSDYALLPMPIPKGRLLQRGFNLPLVFAKQLSQHFQLPILASHQVCLPELIQKHQKQGRLSRKKRLKNHRIYQINHKLPAKIIIIDDIFTTGTSINDLAKQLRGKGVKSVDAWVFSRGFLD